MFRLRTIVNIFVFFLVFAAIVFGLRWRDGYEAAKTQDKSITFGEYVRQDLQAITKGAGELREIVQEAKKAPDAVRTGQLDKLAQFLDLYRDEYSEYPESLNQLVGTYLDERSSDFLRSDDLEYQKIFSGYELSIVLDSGERYTIRK